jgi:proteasome lid subunit RPN8/RPN11
MQRRDEVRVSRTVLDAIAAHARRDNPNECCGLLVGTEAEVTEAVATRNVASDPRRHYEVSPVDHFAQIRKCREHVAHGSPAVSVVGAYHSHPHSVPEPSPTDLEQAFEEFLYIIAGPITGPGPVDCRGYRLNEGVLTAVRLVAFPGAGKV